jgi:hypothetical protein
MDQSANPHLQVRAWLAGFLEGRYHASIEDAHNFAWRAAEDPGLFARALLWAQTGTVSSIELQHLLDEYKLG